MNATDVIGWGWGLGKDSWKPLCTNKKQKGLGCFQCVNILGGAQPGGRQSFQSLRRGRWRARGPVLPGGRGSLQPRGGRGCGSPRRGASRPGPGPRSGGGAAGCGAGTLVPHKGPEVCAKPRQLSGRHFHGGFQQGRGPLAALRGGGIAPAASAAPFPASRQVPRLPRPGAPGRDVFGACSRRGRRGHPTR